MDRLSGLRAAFGALHPNIRGMLWMVLAGILFISFNAVIRHISRDMAPMQAAFLRYIFGLAVLLPYLARANPENDPCRSALVQRT